MQNRVKFTERRREMDFTSADDRSSDEEGVCAKRKKTEAWTSRKRKAEHSQKVGRNGKALTVWKSRILEDDDMDGESDDEPIIARVTSPRVVSSDDGGEQGGVRNGQLTAVEGGQLSKDLANEERPDKAFTTPNAKKNGLANACSGRIFVTIPKHFFGPVTAEYDPVRGTGVRVGEHWPDRLSCRQWGAHSPHVAGIAGQARIGAQSIALSGGYEDDEDHGWYFIYTGSGGRDLSGNKRTNKEQSKEQTFEKYNLALKVSCEEGYPVRVVRSHKERNSAFAPKQKVVRYDGVYRVEKCWRKRGKQGSIMCRFLFVRCDNERAPWERDNSDSDDEGSKESSDDENDPRERIVPKIAELQGAQDIFERSKPPAWDWLEDEKRWGWIRPHPTSQLGAKSAPGKRKRVTVAPVCRIVPSLASNNESSQEEDSSDDDKKERADVEEEPADVTLAIEASPATPDGNVPGDSCGDDVSGPSQPETGDVVTGVCARDTKDVSTAALQQRDADLTDDEDDFPLAVRRSGDVSEEEDGDIGAAALRGLNDVSAAAGLKAGDSGMTAGRRTGAERGGDDVRAGGDQRAADVSGATGQGSGVVCMAKGQTNEDDDMEADVADDVEDDDDVMELGKSETAAADPWKGESPGSGGGVKAVKCGVLGPKLTPEPEVRSHPATVLLEPRRLNFVRFSEGEREISAASEEEAGVRKPCRGALLEGLTPIFCDLAADQQSVQKFSPLDDVYDRDNAYDRELKRSRVSGVPQESPGAVTGGRLGEKVTGGVSEELAEKSPGRVPGGRLGEGVPGGVSKELPGESPDKVPGGRSGENVPRGQSEKHARLNSVRESVNWGVKLAERELEATVREKLLVNRLQEAEQQGRTLATKVLEYGKRYRSFEAGETVLIEKLQNSESARLELEERLRKETRERRALEQKLRECEQASDRLERRFWECKMARADAEWRLQESLKVQAALDARLGECDEARAVVESRLQESEKSRKVLEARLQESEKLREALEGQARERETRRSADALTRESAANKERQRWVERVGFLFWTVDEVTRGASESDLVAGAANRAAALEKLLGELEGGASGVRTGGVVDRARDRLLSLSAEVKTGREEVTMLGEMLDQSERENEQLREELERERGSAPVRGVEK